MSTLTFQLDETKAGQLAEVARRRGLEVEELLRQITDEFLSRPPASDAAFQKALADSTRENEELLPAVGEVMNFLTLEQVLAIHDEVIRLHGGDPGVHDLGLVESAISQPRATFGGQYLNPTLPDMAAALGFSMVSNHGFKDGNKRVGFTATDVFLRLNGHKIGAPVDETEQVILAIASSTMTREEFAEWLRQHIIPL